MPQPSENSKKSPASRTDLGKMYPVPKSFDELARERERVDKLHAQHAPKHVVLLISIKIYSILAGFVASISLSFAILPTNIIAGVFFGFLIGLAWFGYAIWMVKSVSDSFQNLGFSAASFLQLYAFCYSVLACASYYFTARISLIIFLILASCLHFILVYILLRASLKSS
jgi:hypothetical protein